MPDDPRPWPLESTRRGPDLAILRVRLDTLTNPRTGRALERTVLEAPDWVNVVALTEVEGRPAVVCVRQYRFGTGAVTTEIPGGVVDPGEEHRAAAERELAEETGYTAARWTYLGAVEPNPAFLDNRCHHWLAEDARATATPALDPGEDIAVVLVPLDELPAQIAAGEIAHSLVITALSRVLDLRTEPR